MKKVILSIIIAVMILGLAACSGNSTVTVTETATPTAPQAPLRAPKATPVTAKLTPTETVAPTPSPTVEPTPAQIVWGEGEDGQPEGNIPADISANGYTPDSSSDVFEDEGYIIFRNLSGILVFDKNKNETIAVLPRCSAFTYCDKNVYYTGYNSKTGKSNITRYSVASGKTKIIKQMDNTAVSMQEYNGRLYYAYLTDSKDATKTATQLRSVALDGGDMHIIGAQYIRNFAIKDGFVYCYEANKIYGSGLYKLSLKDGKQVRISVDFSHSDRLEIIGDTLFYSSVHNTDGEHCTIHLYDIKTGSESYFNLGVTGWSNGDSDFTILGRYLIYTDPGNFFYSEKAYVRAYDLDSGKIYDLADSDTVTYDIHTTKDGVYISPDKSDGTSKLYKAAVSGGQAQLKEIMSHAAPAKTPSSDTVIIADSGGNIYGGYSGGKWLSHSEAAAYCKGQMTFGEYNLAGLKGTAVSSGITCTEGFDNYSHTCLMPPGVNDANGCFDLNIPGAGDIDYDYSKDPLCFSYLYYGGKLPDIETVSDTSKLKRAIQKLLDKNLGKGKAEANIRAAVSADIDNDGRKETVVNADWVSGYCGSGGPGEGDPWYCLSCIIESNGTVKVIEDYYFVPTAEQPDPYDDQFFYVQNIIDLDGDGISELVSVWMAGEQNVITVYKYNGKNVKEIMHYFVSYDA